MVKNLPAMRETWVGSLGWEDPLEKGMATHSSILAWRTPWTEEPGGLQSAGLHSYPASEVRGGDERSYPVSEVRGGKERSYPVSEVRGGGQEEKGTTDDEMVGWHHQLNGYDFE